MPSTPTEAKTVPLARFMGQVAYGADLQRIIEDLCGNRDIRLPETSARHHYEMAVKHRASLLPLIDEMAKALERLGSNEAFDVATPELSDEIRMRLDYARAAHSRYTEFMEQNNG